MFVEKKKKKHASKRILLPPTLSNGQPAISLPTNDFLQWLHSPQPAVMSKNAVQGKEEGSQWKTQQSLRKQVVFNPSSLIGTITSLGGRPHHPPLDGRGPSDAGRVSHRLSISHTWEAAECLPWSQATTSPSSASLTSWHFLVYVPVAWESWLFCYPPYPGHLTAALD